MLCPRLALYFLGGYLSFYSIIAMACPAIADNTCFSLGRRLAGRPRPKTKLSNVGRFAESESESAMADLRLESFYRGPRPQAGCLGDLRGNRLDSLRPFTALCSGCEWRVCFPDEPLCVLKRN